MSFMYVPAGPTEALRRLELKAWTLRTVKAWLDRAAPYVGEAFYSWDKGKLDEIKDKFIPKTLPGEMGCMKACYKVLDILYSSKVSKELLDTVLSRAKAKAEAEARRRPDVLKMHMDRAKAEAVDADKTLTDAEARHKAIWQMTSPHNTSDHLFQLMGEKGLAGEKVKSPNAQAEQKIRDMTGNGTGVYFFGLAVNDNHTVTLAVERAADGTQKMYWLDQNNPGLRTEIRTGQLGATLQNVTGYTTTTNIYPFRPPTGGAP